MKFSSLSGKIVHSRVRLYECIMAFVEGKCGQRDPTAGVVLPEILNYCIEHQVPFVLTFVPGSGYDLQPYEQEDVNDSKEKGEA